MHFDYAGTVEMVNADGSHQKRLTSSPRSESAQAWLGDGRIVYSVAHPDSPRADFFLMNSDGSAVRRLPQLVAATDPIDWFWPLKGPHP